MPALADVRARIARDTVRFSHYVPAADLGVADEAVEVTDLDGDISTERHDCGCVTRDRRWQVPGWDCFSTTTVVNCGGHKPAPRPVPAEDWVAVLLGS